LGASFVDTDELIVLELALQRLEHAAGEVRQVHAFELVGAKSRLDLREVEQVVDEARQLTRLAVNDAVVLVRALRVLQPSKLQRFGEQLDQRQRRFQVVRHAGDEARFQLRHAHLAGGRSRDEEDADRHHAGQHRHHRPLRPARAATISGIAWLA
jgi:hypothetical protein